MVAIFGDIVYICRRNEKNVSTTKLLTEIQRVSNSPSNLRGDRGH